MSKSDFDDRGHADADSLIAEIGKAIVMDGRYQTDDWSGIALVGNFSGGREGLHGYAFQADGSWTGRIPDDTILDMMLDLKRVMEEKEGMAWHQCLVQIWRTEQSVNIKFEYDDPQRWSVTPANLEQKVEELRP